MRRGICSGGIIKKVPSFERHFPVGLLQMFEEEVRYTSQQMLGGVSSTDAMVPVRVDVHVELLVGLYKGFAIFGSVAQMYIVVGGAMHQEEFAMKIVYTVHGR